MADDFTLMTTDSMTVMLNNEGCCVKHPHVVIRKKTSTGEVYQKESCEECDKEYAQQQAELREQRAELKRQLQELEQSGKQQKSKSMVSEASDESAPNTAFPTPSPFKGSAPPPSNDREAYAAPGMLSLEGLAYQMNRMQQMQDWILNQKESELQLLRSKYEEQQRELMKKEVEMALLKERLTTMQETMTKELEAVKLASRRGGGEGKAIHIGELHVSVKENASSEELAAATEQAFQKRLEDENYHRKSNNKHTMVAAVGTGMAAGAAAGVVTATAAMPDKTVVTSAPTTSAAPTMASPAAAETVMATNGGKMREAPDMMNEETSMMNEEPSMMKEEPSMMKKEPPQMKEEEPPKMKEPPVYPDEDDGPELIDDEPVVEIKEVPKPAPVVRQATPAYAAPVAAAAVGAGAAAATMAAVDEDQSGEEQSEELDYFDVNAPVGKNSLISESTGPPEQRGVPMQASVQSLKALPREKDFGGLENSNVPGVSQMKGGEGPRGDFPKEFTVDPSGPPQVPLKEDVTMGTLSAGVSDIPDDMTYGQTVASSTYGEDRIKVTSRHVLDPYGDEGTYSGVVLASTGMPHGVGRMVYKDDGRTYEGDWRHGRWHGFGKATFANGDSFEGQYRFDQRHGRGKYNWNDGREYDGMFYEDKRQGKGTFRWPDGAVYIGEFNHGQREGHGKYVFADGGFYEGEWLDGRYDGYGVCKWSDGRTYDGEWKQGMAHGRGKETNANGSIRHDGQWIEDEPVRDGTSEYES